MAGSLDDFQFNHGVGFSPAQEEMYSALREPVEINFPSLELKKLGSFLRWFGLRLELKGVAANSRLSFEARGCTIGLATTVITMPNILFLFESVNHYDANRTVGVPYARGGS